MKTETLFEKAKKITDNARKQSKKRSSFTQKEKSLFNMLTHNHDKNITRVCR